MHMVRKDRKRDASPANREGLKNNMVKRIRVHGGCLGAVRRRRAWQAAKSLGEEQTSIEPGMPEWGNPHSGNAVYHMLNP